MFDSSFTVICLVEQLGDPYEACIKTTGWLIPKMKLASSLGV
jgi:hypothetical protein